MPTSKLKLVAVLTLSALGIAACGSSNTDTLAPPEPVAPQPQPPQPPQPQSYTLFVKDQFANTSDNTDPVEINDIEFNFDNSDNPRAYDDLLRNN